VWHDTCHEACAPTPLGDASHPSKTKATARRRRCVGRLRAPGPNMREREHGTVGARGTDALRLALSQISRNMFKVASSPQVMEGTAKMLVLAVGVRSTAGAISVVMKETHVAVAATAATAAPIAPAATVAQTTRTRLDPIRFDGEHCTRYHARVATTALRCGAGERVGAAAEAHTHGREGSSPVRT
jgi:hypothetical protein